ncbi:CDF family Co(II)/Ni(II) efflux transporter DmeF [Vibrio natriegens]|uniref:Cation transporter n=1 Tax=Vibrio natriegens NBRC 15636 = ATCC 14048 = DSM 759 TaxID=1219067 RepID=A0AAN0Y8E5_VIBNA|nr:CDF family Co(II)/Ni(II) efflux transporter DmeF [Vibrio natriegens]ALR18858.1 cation transporter [Vibrio natriegens NBRC 15636 = ATCC 14048 = DSM 759]ANQ15692.1 cation transporter [Vibrio natriegens NBRC 15636 = ATCC 14048 = DSM 759]MDX6029332.1 CDF family Co(II)/Ni(II) efflux transporter DmeF [Vibrio natriegens NBRC 15636 = ATCC 14048 = DSM 759]UUI13966.1 CDF family Co(II)/Ni(II) efflux transporter DmeF [Vibrio natriegens]WRS51227.1 CDF family Co(II)/Ni(II) efflux transporter DmeF [Vibrio
MTVSQHSHDFVSHNHQGERRTFYVLLLTLVTMIVEISAGTLFGSMALLADGWHMGTHAAAFCITLFAYRYAKQHANSERFSFGTGKVSVLGGFTSAIALGIVALMMMVESVHRLFNPETIKFNEAIMVAVIGLVVNLASMLLLKDHHHHGHEHHHHDHHHEHHHDHNLAAAYFHVLADTLTSLLAIVALIIGKFYGWVWLDAAMGIVGALVIGKWTLGLIRQTAPVLLDESIDEQYRQDIRAELDPYADVVDLHVWKVSGHHYSAAIAIKNRSNKSLGEFKQMLSKFDKIHHLTLELQND